MNSTTSPAVLIGAVNELREHCHATGAIGMAATYRLDGGEVTIDYRADDWLKLRIIAPGRETTKVLAPDWCQYDNEGANAWR